MTATRPVPTARGAGGALDVAALRAREFATLVAGGARYLNSASTGPYPDSTRAALDAMTALRAEPHRISYELQFGTLARMRARCAELVGAHADEIALAFNTSAGINLAARALPLQPGDVVVTSDREFPANMYPWMAVERSRGVRLQVVPCAGLHPDEEALLAALDAPRVKLLALSWISSMSGYRVDLARLGAACRERGIWFVVDAIQGVGNSPLDLREVHVDVLACGAQKWLLSPWGTGFTYVRRDLVSRLTPPDAGWLAVEGSEDFSRLLQYDLTWRDAARRFEVGTLPYQEFAGAVASVELLLALGPANVAAHVAALADRVVAWAQGCGSVRLVTPADPAHRGGVVCVAPRDPEAAARRLAAARVIHSMREGIVRLAPHCFNTADEVDAALAALEG